MTARYSEQAGQKCCVFAYCALSGVETVRMTETWSLDIEDIKCGDTMLVVPTSVGSCPTRLLSGTA